MSVQYYAYTVLGVKFNMSDLLKKKKVKSCRHKNDPNAKFCSKCGQPIWAETEGYPDWFDEDKADGLDIINSTDDLFAIVGIKLAEVGGCGSDCAKIETSFREDSDHKQRIKKILEKWGYWNEESFGLWSVMYCSY